MSSEPSASPWHAVIETFVRTSPITVGTGATALGGIPPSLSLFVGLVLLSLVLGLARLAANVCIPVSKALGDGYAYRVRRRLEGPPTPGVPDPEPVDS